MRQLFYCSSLLVCFSVISLQILSPTHSPDLQVRLPLGVAQSFTFTAPAPITTLTDVSVAGLSSSSNVFDVPGYGVEFDPNDTRFGFNPKCGRHPGWCLEHSECVLLFPR